ncbi:MAG: undecaprenyl-diphosphate phosphatase [Proteobacteria bacterium]|nr:undecaprenyl-diphosphate phosphatase [Pseudomonadota bacterium]
METIKAVTLGLIQGLTEFLPVSSSGHLVLGQHLFGIKEPEILFDVLLHLGTLAAVFIVFRRDIASLVREFFRLPTRLKNRAVAAEAWRTEDDFRLLILIVAGSVPTALIGLLFKDIFESLFASTRAVGLALIVTGVVLFLTRWSAGARGRKTGAFRAGDALIVGLAQGLAITPGLSRSGLTISTGLYLGLDRDLAARFSFLLSIPAIFGALILQLRSAAPTSFSPLDMGLGFLAALISGLAALVVLLRLVRGGRLHYFAWYCWAIGLLSLFLS